MFCVFPYDPRNGLVDFLTAAAGLDAQNEVPACAVGLEHRVAINTVAFLSGLCITYRTLKIEGLFYRIHGPSLRRAAGEFVAHRQSPACPSETQKPSPENRCVSSATGPAELSPELERAYRHPSETDHASSKHRKRAWFRGDAVDNDSGIPT